MDITTLDLMGNVPFEVFNLAPESSYLSKLSEMLYYILHLGASEP